MTDKYAMVFDADRCFGCYGCEVACQQEHDLAQDQKWIRISQIGPKKIGERMQMRFVPRVCAHCHIPLCLKACPVAAISRDNHGVVRIDELKCNGCLDCTWACPYGAIHFDQARNLAGKCDLCSSRLAQGLLPSCAHHCPAKAIRLIKGGEAKELEAGRRVISSGLLRIVYSP